MGDVVAVQFNYDMARMSCGECGIRFMMPESIRAERQKDGKAWYCPNGHARVYMESDVDRLKRELASAQRELAAQRERAATNFAARLKAEQEARRLKKRAAGGVCPCCNRSFVTLSRHMKTKHPDFIEEAHRG